MTCFVIFGGGGDLAWRKLVPALYNLYLDKKTEDFTLIIVDRHEVSLDRFLDGINQFSRTGKANPDQWKAFASHIKTVQGDFTDDALYQKIKELCKGETIFYLSVPPSLFAEIPKHLKKAGLVANSRLVVEKPLGYDLASALELNRGMGESFPEDQIFRIDHYLGKETVQNILAFRFANPLFEPIWNTKYIDYVTITAAETVGIENRGSYYEHAGALRDMIQNHLMQLLCCVAMEPMASFEANEVRNKKLDVLHSIRPIKPDEVNKMVVRGQYGPGWMEGVLVPGYRQEEGVASNSNTETYAALQLFIDNWRWQGVPFYLRTGKRLSKRVTFISIHFKDVPHQAFPTPAAFDWKSARLLISIQPKEGISVRFHAKVPGSELRLKSVEMIFDYNKAFKVQSHDAYETLIYDVIKNDATLFMRADQIEASWKLLSPILQMWQQYPPVDFPNYEAGGDGPQAANWLIAQEGHNWPNLRDHLP